MRLRFRAPRLEREGMADEQIIGQELRSGDEAGRPDDRIDDERHDEENRLKASYVRSVNEALDAVG